VHPQFPILYVGLVTINKIGVYVFGPDGTLNFVDAVDNPAPTNCWFLLNKAATRMYVVDTASNQVTTFDVGTDPLVPKALGVTQLKGTGFGFELALSDDGRFLYVISQQAAATGSPAIMLYMCCRLAPMETRLQRLRRICFPLTCLILLKAHVGSAS
jgi:hypothetical protein